MSPKRWKRQRRGAVDTSVLVAGVSAFKVNVSPTTPSGILLRDWLEHDTFTWLITGEIVGEYGEVLRRLNVKPALIRTIIKLLGEEAELVSRIKTIAAHPDPEDALFWECAESGDADFIVTLNPKDFPQGKLRAKVIAPGDPLPTIRHKPKIRRRPSKRRRRQ